MGAAVLGLGLVAGATQAEDITLNLASYGGIAQEAEMKALFEPAAKKLGITIKPFSIQGTARIATLRAQQKANAPTFDIMEFFAGVCEQLSREGLTEKLDYNIINTDGIPKEVIGENWVGIDTYTSVISYNTSTFKTGGPQTWADVWDLKKYPGKRSFNPSDHTLEMALLADGVAPDKLYPADIDRAFRKLEEIKPSVVAWWTTGAQATQLARNEETDVQSTWHERVEEAIKTGAPYAFHFNQAIVGSDCMVIPKGAPHKDLAMKVMNLAISAEAQADLPKYTTNGPINTKAYATGKITAAQAKDLSTSPENLQHMIVQDVKWWSEHGSEVQERFNKLLN